MPGAKLDFSGLNWADSPDAPHARSKTFEKDGKRIRLVEFSQGYEETGWCEKGHVGYVIEGELEIDFGGGERVRFRQGDGIFIIAGSRHKARPIGKKARLFLVEEV